ncbi:4-hydroxybenzoate synthetase [Paenibacillus pectinilyticus]|uniref:4-hydroxybenzoate synthetase n=1 Tax=Paenibacillus pectinilyticus TaxID=512399 RepID=A0A1C1A0R9_9BACL|nr:chorismate pyruvate-lyase family protein [Paenibacillus pectinilyticus]OCT13976.1 4-hydroxybenzoate synthetase [Paenibacillus pectinilyticus]
MTDRHANSKDSQHAGETLDFLQRLIFDMLLVTDGRTTDLLESLLDEKMRVTVLRQEQLNEEHADPTYESSGASLYVRESILISDKSDIIVSHNIAIVNSKHVPAALFEKIAHRQEGIGKSISSMGLQSYRKVVDSGRRSEEEAVDLFQKPISLRIPELHDKIPYKKYDIYFQLLPGIHMLEYFNPAIIKHRLNQVFNSNMEG